MSCSPAYCKKRNLWHWPRGSPPAVQIHGLRPQSIPNHIVVPSYHPDASRDIAMQQPRAPVTPDDVLTNAVRRQIESYLSPGNVQRDFVFQQYLSAYNGYFPIHMLAQYPGIQQIYNSAGAPTESVQSLILRSLENSRLVSSTECGSYVYPTSSKFPQSSNMNPYRTIVSPDHSEMGSVCVNNNESYKGKDSSTQATVATTSASGSPTSFVTADSMMSQDGYLLPGHFPPIYNGYRVAYVNPTAPLSRPVPKQPPSVIYQPHYVPGTPSPLCVPPSTPIKQNQQAPSPAQLYATHPYVAATPGMTPSPGQQYVTQPNGYAAPAPQQQQVHAAAPSWTPGKHDVQQPPYQMTPHAAAAPPGPYMIPAVNTPYPQSVMAAMAYPDYSHTEHGHHHPPMMENHHDASTVGSSVATDHHNPFVPQPSPHVMANYYEQPPPPPNSPPKQPIFKNNRKGQRNNKHGGRGGNRRNKNYPKRGAGGNNGEDERSSPTSSRETSPTADPTTAKDMEPKPYLAAALHRPATAAGPKEAPAVAAAKQTDDDDEGAEAMEKQMKELSVGE